MKHRIIEFKPKTDDRGTLVPIEEEGDIPFKIRRVFYIYGAPDIVERGGHAHAECEQVIICVVGYTNVTIEEDGESFYYELYQKQNHGIYIPKGVKVTYSSSPFSVALVLASQPYDPEDYIYE